MLKQTCIPILQIDSKDLEDINNKLIDFDIEVVSTFGKEDRTSLYIYGEKVNILKLIDWLSNSYLGCAELEE